MPRPSTRVTRSALRQALQRCRAFLDRSRRAGSRSRLARAVPKVLRGRYSLRYGHAMKLMQEKKISFLDTSAAAAGHWAETDGDSIWISPLKRWTQDDLYYTLLHEALHGLVRRGDNGSELAEHREHLLMTNIDLKLVDDPSNPSPWL